MNYFCGQIPFSAMSGKIALIIKYFNHYFLAQSKYELHSPFIYKFYKEILNDHTDYAQYKSVEKLRRRLLQDNRFLSRADLGARSPEFPLQKKLITIRTIVRRSSVSPRNGRLLFRLSHYFRPENILELGTSLGLSTAYLKAGHPEGTITTIEGCREIANEARRNFETLGFGDIVQRTGNFDDLLPGMLAESSPPDLIFIDGNHRKEATLNYFNRFLQHIKPSTVIIFDDIHWSDGMDEAWTAIKRNKDVRVTVDLFTMGIVFFREELSKEDFVIRF
ncbi:MAG: class I SAM-dependent methyltransferase [Bacteroidetes bacterium]|nr:class I SAM-dependent methyltransferase [Bacteroidota bacterium]